MTEVTIRIALTDGLPVLAVSGDPEALLGFGADDLLSGKVTLRARVHADDQDLAAALFEPNSEQSAGTSNIRLRHAGGQIRCIRVSYKKELAGESSLLELHLQDATKLPRSLPELDAATNFAVIMDTTDYYLYFKNRNHVITAASRSLLALCSPTRQWSDLIGKTDYDVFPEPFADQYHRLDKLVFAGQAVAREIQQLPGKDGQNRWIDNAEYPICDDNGSIMGLCGIARDITEQMRTRAHLHDEQEHRRAVFDTVASPIFVKDSAHRIVAANRAFCEMNGLGLEDVIGQTLIDQFPPELGEKIRAADRRVLQSGIPESEEQMPVLNGQQRTLIVNKTRLIDATGAKFVVASMHDITGIRRIEQSNRESERRWQFAVEDAGDGLWDWNIQTDKVYFSKRWKEMLGFDEDEIGDDLDEWKSRVHSDDLPLVMATLTAHLASRTAKYVTEFRIKCKDGRWKWILDRGLVIERAADGKPLRAIGTHTDISERKLSEETLRRQNAVMNQFNTMAVGRELRMIQLKQEVNALCAQLGLPPRHRVVAKLPPGASNN